MLEILQRQRTDTGHTGWIALALTDVVMPRMGGMALLQALRDKGMGMGVVMISGRPFSARGVS